MIRLVEGIILKYGWLFRYIDTKPSILECFVVRRLVKRKADKESKWLKDKGWNNYLSFWYSPKNPGQPYFKYEALLLTCYQPKAGRG